MSTKTSQIACIALTLCLLLCGAQTAHAQQAIRYPQLLEHDGKHFAAYVNEINGTPTWVIDTDSLDFTLGSSMYLSTESGVETAADAFVDAHKGVFGLDTKQLGEPRIATNERLWFVRYPQVHENLRVWAADLVLAVRTNGALVSAAAGLFPKVNVNTTPTLSSSAALQTALGAAAVASAQGSVKTDLVIVPVELEGAYAFGLAWEVIVYDYDHDPPLSKTYLIDAHTGNILEEYDNIGGATGLPNERRTDASAASPIVLAASGGHVPLFMAHGREDQARQRAGSEPAVDECGYNPAQPDGIKGTVSLNYHVTPNNKEDALENVLNAPFPYAKYSVAGGSYSCTGYADENGSYWASLPGTGPYTISFIMANDRFRVESSDALFADCDTVQSFTVSEVEGTTTLDFGWGWGTKREDGATDVALNGIYHAREMYEYYNTSLEFSGLDDAQMKINVVNRDDARVNFPHNLTIHAGGKPGRSSEVILHEYGHLVQFAILNSDTGVGVVLASIREGAADFFAADKTGNSLFGGPAVSTLHNDGPVAWRELSQTCPWLPFDRRSEWDGICRDHILSTTIDHKYKEGMALAGAAWEVRTTAGSNVASFLMDALQMSSVRTTIVEFRDAFTKAAETEYPTLIESAFTTRRIGGPNMSTNLAVTCSATGSPRRPQLTWDDNSSLETGYFVERSTNKTDWSQVADLPAIASGSGSYEDTGATCPGSVLYYRVAAYRSFTDPVDVTRTYSEAVRYPSQSGGDNAAQSIIALSDQVVELQADSVAQDVTTSLQGAYPNPFNPVTTVSFSIAEAGPVRLRVYDMLGREVAMLVDSDMVAGPHSVKFNAAPLPSGMYLLRMETALQHWTQWVSLVK